MISILFIRHGATAGNLEKRYIGSTDEPLCDTGILQVKKIKEQNFHPDYIFVSPMLRTRQTTQHIFPNMQYTVVDDFAEMDFGIFEGKSAAELANNKEYRLWVDSMCLTPVPGGEDVKKFKMRCCKAFEKIIKNVPDNACVALVIHGGVIMSIMEEYAKPKRSFYDYQIANGQYILCKFDKDAININ
ncbi:MAG: histidine phosphatase family protein [Clostridia bacterium]|nr:histidine phosphatase family protein [Clostridia bacterium]